MIISLLHQNTILVPLFIANKHKMPLPDETSGLSPLAGDVTPTAGCAAVDDVTVTDGCVDAEAEPLTAYVTMLTNCAYQLDVISQAFLYVYIIYEGHLIN